MSAWKKVSAGVVLFLLLFASLLLSGCVQPKTSMVPMRDGTKLATDVYVKPGQQPHGSILIRTPYNKNGMASLGKLLSPQGWPVVIQDMRGRYASQGNDTVFRNESTDGPDTLAWVASQPFSNGKVATWGASALGITQYLTAGSNPPNLACQYIGVATPDLFAWAMYQGGEFRKNLVANWLMDEGSTYILPDVYLHENSSDPYWSTTSISTRYDQVNVPAIHLGGWYDIFTQGILDGFDGYQHHGGPGALGKSKLIVGPWTHGTMGLTQQGQLVYPKNSVDNFSNNLFWAMANEYTQGTVQGYDEYPAVTYYVMGDPDPNGSGNFWVQANDWPPATIPETWYFHVNHTLQQTPSIYGEPFSYLYNPRNPVPTIGGSELFGDAGPRDQRPVESRSDVIVFTSPPLTEHKQTIGRVHATLYVSSDCVDTDFTVKLSDVYPDGRSMLICDGILRMRDRNGSDHWVLMTPGTIYRVDVDLTSLAYMWDPGHCIRVAVSSSNSPRFLTNPNTADGIARNTTSVMATNNLFVDAAHPSCLVLPYYPCNDTAPPVVHLQPSMRSSLLSQLTRFSWSEMIPCSGV
jgi:hypothetical protein